MLEPTSGEVEMLLPEVAPIEAARRETLAPTLDRADMRRRRDTRGSGILARVVRVVGSTCRLRLVIK